MKRGMHLMKRIVILMTEMLVMLFILTGCADKSTIQLVTEYNGEKVDLCVPEIRQYLEAESPEEQASLLWKFSYLDAAYQNISFEWEGDGSTVYTVSFADNRKFEHAQTYETTDTSLYMSGYFLPGSTYYWKITGDVEGSTSKVDKFRVLDEPVRFISTQSIINVRDLGGWKTNEKKTVKYEQIYRGGKTNPGGENLCDEEDRILFSEKLGIRTEIDLRTAGWDDGGQTESVFGSDVLYVKAPLGGYAYILPEFYQSEPKRVHDPQFLKSVREIFEVLGEEENYPVYFHCNAGADRTGTLAFLINGVLGVSYEDLTRDFELTSFSSGGARWRSGIVEDSLTFDGTGVMQDDEENYVAWDELCDMMLEEYGGSEGNLQAAIENYLTKACGVKKEHIRTLKNVMLD